VHFLHTLGGTECLLWSKWKKGQKGLKKGLKMVIFGVFVCTKKASPGFTKKGQNSSNLHQRKSEKMQIWWSKMCIFAHFDF
jgi:hypothetical protein